MHSMSPSKEQEKVASDGASCSTRRRVSEPGRKDGEVDAKVTKQRRRSDADTKARKQRRSSDASSTSTKPSPRLCDDGTPKPAVSEGWEFPMSQDEKKHRLVCILEAEMIEADFRAWEATCRADELEDELDGECAESFVADEEAGAYQEWIEKHESDASAAGVGDAHANAAAATTGDEVLSGGLRKELVHMVSQQSSFLVLGLAVAFVLATLCAWKLFPSSHAASVVSVKLVRESEVDDSVIGSVLEHSANDATVHNWLPGATSEVQKFSLHDVSWNAVDHKQGDAAPSLSGEGPIPQGGQFSAQSVAMQQLLGFAPPASISHQNVFEHKSSLAQPVAGALHDGLQNSGFGVAPAFEPESRFSEEDLLAQPEAAAQQLWQLGLGFLSESKCWEAGNLFSRALRIIDRAVDLLSQAGEPGTSSEAHLSMDKVEGIKFLLEVRRELVADQGFALVCVQSFPDAISVINEYLETAKGSEPPHLLNALGYAYFQLGDYSSAREVFRMGVWMKKTEPTLWMNLAVAEMSAGDLEAADQAIIQAADEASKLDKDSDSAKDAMQTLLECTHQLSARAKGDMPASPPTVNLFYNPHWRWGD